MNKILMGSMLLAGFGMVGGQGADKALDAAALKSALEIKGYTVQVLNSEKDSELYQVIIEQDGFKVPITASLSKSKSYVWYAVNLGKVTEKTKWEALLRRNGFIQPGSFYVSSGDFLQASYPMENRGISPERLDGDLKRFVSDVIASSGAWGQE